MTDAEQMDDMRVLGFGSRLRQGSGLHGKLYKLPTRHTVLTYAHSMRHPVLTYASSMWHPVLNYARAMQLPVLT
eukprot:3457030-Rhodomonas_salina.2